MAIASINDDTLIRSIPTSNGRRQCSPMNSNPSLHMLVYASLMAALTAVGAFLSIPIGPVPIVLQNLFVLLTGLLLSRRWALASMAIYLLAGTCGLPVFAGGTGGIGKLIGPTGGYLLGYLPAVYLIAMVSEKKAGRVVYDVLAMVGASLIIYAFGVSWLKTITAMPWSKALTVGMVPFLIGDALKIAAAVPIAKALRPIMRHGAIRSQAAV
jgi:biotin transport system substrate-specific component